MTKTTRPLLSLYQRPNDCACARVFGAYGAGVSTTLLGRAKYETASEHMGVSWLLESFSGNSLGQGIHRRTFFRDVLSGWTGRSAETRTTFTTPGRRDAVLHCVCQTRPPKCRMFFVFHPPPPPGVSSWFPVETLLFFGSGTPKYRT